MVFSRENPVKSALEKCFFSCRAHLQTVFRLGYEREEILSWFQVLCKELTTIIELIGTYYKENNEKTVCHTNILLYLTQLLTCLSLSINIFVTEEESKLILIEARKSILSQMSCCLELLETGKKLTESGSFVKWMDTALEKISEINPNESRSRAINTFNETREIFEEVLSHAMSIAQVSLSEDSKIIRGSCQSVLTTLNSLEIELKNTIINGAMVTLFMDASSDKLCLLEKKVNTAVLKLCLKTFSQYLVPLEKIETFCLNEENRGKNDIFDGLVGDFDLHVDRIMQIGLFAVSCSSDLGKGIKIRSCLASLEALESELVPTLNSVLKEKSPRNLKTANILIKHWIEQATLLQKLIFLIIDPFAFCQVIFEECTDLVDLLSNSLRKKNLISQEDVHLFLASAKVLQTFLQQAQIEFTPIEMNNIEPKLKDYNEVMEEVYKSCKILLTDPENSKRVLKRCKILLTVLKRLWYCFTDEIVQNTNSSTLDKQLDDLPLKLDNLQIDHIITRGKQILQDRSVLYKTPTKQSKITLSGLPLSKLVHLRQLSFANSSGRNEPSLDLQITNILSDMVNLSTALK